MNEEQCFLVKDVDDIVRMAGSDTEYRIVAIEDGLAWIKHVNTGQSNLEPIEKLIFVRGKQVGGLADLIPEPMASNELIPQLRWEQFEPGRVILVSDRFSATFTCHCGAGAGADDGVVGD